MTIFETVGMAYVILSALIGTALLIYLVWLGGKCVQKERDK